MNRRLKTLAILFTLLAGGCSTNQVVGKWRVKRAYDAASQTWTEMRYDAFVELSSDGKFKAILPGEPERAGRYELDESVNPRRFVATDSADRAFRGIYKVEGDKLTVRGGESAVHLEFLQSFDPSSDKTRLPVVEFVREKE